MKKTFINTTVVLTLIMMLGVAWADDVAKAGQNLLAQHGGAVITVRAIIKQHISFGSMGGEDEDMTNEMVGTVIDPSGITVVSLSEIDPSSAMERLMGGMMGDAGGLGDFKMESEIKSVTLLLDGDREITADVVLRDKDQDLAFLRPVEPLAEPMTAVDVNNSAEPQTLDMVISLSRLGKIANRVHSATAVRISAVVKKPRKFFVLNMGDASSMGSPVFTMDGKLIGLTMIRMSGVDDSMGGLMGGMSGLSDSVMPIVIPVQDIVDVLEQLPEREPATDESAE